MDDGASGEAVPKILRALGDPVRWQVVRRIAAEGELSGASFERSLGLAKSTISHHLRILTTAGVVVTRKDGRTHWHRLDRTTLAAVADCMAALLGPEADTSVAENPPGQPDANLLTW